MIKQIPNRHYNKINGLRAFAATGIVLMHVQANLDCNLNGFVFEKLIPSFTDFVFLFMVISGFSTCCGYYERIVNEKMPLELFYKKRFSRVWPFFALLCLTDFAISPSIESFYEVLANLTLCFGLIPNHGIEVIGVGWFLGLAFVFYFMFPFFCYLLSGKKRAWISLGVSLLLNYLCTAYFDVGRTSIAYSAVFFIFGGVIYLYREQLKNLVERFELVILFSIMGVAMLYYIFGALVPVILLLCGLLMSYALGDRKHSVDLLDNAVTKFFSGISMEIYLCHMAVFRVLVKVVPVGCFNESQGLMYAIMAIGTLVGAVILSCISKKLFAWCCDLKRKR